jgi:arsenite/tail-anchored protein-transporting ATPase
MALPRLIFVTGKGGTGKSTVAAALATAISRRRPVTVADLERRRSVARILGVDLNGAESAAVSDNLEVAALTPRAELEVFIEGIVPLKAISSRMLRSRTFGYVTAALPGLEAFLMMERLRLMAGRAALQDRYAVIDAPATGGAIELLSVARGVKRIASRGTLNRLAGTLEEFLTDANRFGVILTVRPEGLALRETLDAAAELRGRLGVRCIAAVLNGVAEALFTEAEIAKVRALGEPARLAARRREGAKDAARARRELEAADLEVVELPMLFSAALGREELATLADSFAAGTIMG